MPIPLGSRPDDRPSSLRSQDSSPGRALIRKTSLLRIVPTACGQAADIASHAILPDDDFSPHDAITLDARRLRSGRDVAVTIATRSDPSSSRCQISRTRTDSLWAFNTGAEFVSLRTSIPAGGARRDRTDDLLLAKQALSQLSYGPGPSAGTHRRTDANKMVGLGRFELPTSRLSSARSNQLSYKPEITGPGLSVPIEGPTDPPTQHPRVDDLTRQHDADGTGLVREERET
jgi:hypothetical protein